MKKYITLLAFTLPSATLLQAQSPVAVASYLAPIVRGQLNTAGDKWENAG